MNDKNVTIDPRSDSRVIRVFISSTFRDMMQERDLLVKQVFPDLRRLCAKRFVTFIEVDLRWGITEEQAAEGKVLPLCLAEIHRCRPFFIGLLGERYGWIPNSIPAEVIENEPWLHEHLHGRTSVTELEILHGVLNNPEMKAHSFFYFRDPQWVNSQLDAERHELIERDVPSDIEHYGAEEAACRTEERKIKLISLKNRIRESGLPVVENYSTPDIVAKMIHDQFKKLIDQVYPEEDVPEILDRDRLSHEAYAKDKLFACIERPDHVEALNRFADSGRDGNGLVVTGESGGGKTVLMAAWARDRVKNQPDDFLFQHYFGSTPNSSSVDVFLGRLFGELKRHFEIEENIPTEPEQLRGALPIWFAQTSGKGKIVLVLDGLNQIQGDDPDRRLSWLPRFFQPHITIVASALPGVALDSLRERGWHEQELPLAGQAEIAAIVDTYLKEYRKNLSSKLKQDLIMAKGSKNPLFLRTVLEELRQFGSFTDLPDHLAHYLEADNPRILFQLVVRRWRADFDSGRDLTRRALSFLWAARKGLSETECLELLGEGGLPLPRTVWAPLFLAVEPHLSKHFGFLAFGHDFLRQAVADEYLPTDKDQRGAHLKLACYFEALPEMTPRKSEEWPWQLQEAGLWDRLQKVLTDRDLFQTICTGKGFVELGGYWVKLREARPDIIMGRLYLEAYETWEAEEQDSLDIWFLANKLGEFLSTFACYKEADPLFRRALEINETYLGQELPTASATLNNLAGLLMKTNRLDVAEPLVRRALEIKETYYGRGHPSVANQLNNLSLILMDTNRLDEAELLVRRALEIFETSNGPGHPLVAKGLNNLAQVLKDTGRLDEAEPLMKRALEINKTSYGPLHPEVALCLNNLAAFLSGINRLEEAEPLYHRALEIDETIYGPKHPRVATDLSNFAVLLKATHRLDEAELLMRRALKIFENSYGPEHPKFATSLNNLATLLQDTNRLDEAEPLVRRALEINKTSYGSDHPAVAQSLNNLAQLLKNTNRLDEAEPLMRRAQEIDESSYGREHPKVARDLNNLAALLSETNRFEEAEPLYRRALEIDETTYGPEHPEVANSLSNLAQLLKDTSRFDEAELLMRRALQIDEASYGSDHPNVALGLNNLANLLQDTNRIDEAEPLMRRALEIFENSYGPGHPEVALGLNNLAQLLDETNRLEEAEPLMRRALQIDESSYGPDHPSVARDLNNLANLLQDTNRTDEAEPLMRRALQIFEASYGPEHPNVTLGLHNLARLLQATNCQYEAELLYRRALEIDETTYGPEHPNVAYRLGILAQLLQNTNRPDEAELLMRRALQIDEASYGPDHPNVALGLNNLAMLLKATNRLDEAEPLMRRNVEIFLTLRDTTGLSHPNLQPALNNYGGLLLKMGLDREVVLAHLSTLAPDMFKADNTTQ